MCSNGLLRASTKELPTHKGRRRVWIETRKIFETDLSDTLTYHYLINKQKKELTIVTGEMDNRKITIKEKKQMPVIDICNSDITELFEGVNMVTIRVFVDKIVIAPASEEMEQNRAKGRLSDDLITFVDLFAGSGTLSAALEGAGMSCVAAVELDDRYLQNHERNHPGSLAYHTSVTDMDFLLLPQATVLAAGVPCECYSPSGITKKNSLGCGIREAGTTGSLVYFLLRAVEVIRPAMIILENVSSFRSSGIADVIRAVLAARGYSFSEKILTASDYGSMTKRKRWCMVATISEQPFEFPVGDIENTSTIGDILEIPVDERKWQTRHSHKTLSYLLDKEVSDAAKGKGFKMARTFTTDTKVATITKNYYKMQSTGAILVHPDDETKYDWFTPRELARINGLPDSFLLPESKTQAGQIIGQGIAYEPFEAVAKSMIHHIRTAA